jgi:hypothetical protein
VYDLPSKINAFRKIYLDKLFGTGVGERVQEAYRWIMNRASLLASSSSIRKPTSLQITLTETRYTPIF